MSEPSHPNRRPRRAHHARPGALAEAYGENYGEDWDKPMFPMPMLECRRCGETWTPDHRCRGLWRHLLQRLGR